MPPLSICTTDCRVVFSENQKKITYAILSSECTFSKNVWESQFQNTKRDVLYIKGVRDQITTLTRITLALFNLELFLFTLPLIYFFIFLRTSAVTFYYISEILNCFVMYVKRSLDELEHKKHKILRFKIKGCPNILESISKEFSGI